MDQFLNNMSNIASCNDYNSAINTFAHFLNLTNRLEKKNWISACPIPCQQTSYNLVSHEFHKNTLIDPNNFNEEKIVDVALIVALGYSSPIWAYSV